MQNFSFYSPPYFVFGKDKEKNTGTLGSFVVLQEADIANIYRLML